MGGFFGESKFDILYQLPDNYCPKTIYIKQNELINTIQRNTIPFPLFAKPNIGERGFKVEKINDNAELAKYQELNGVSSEPGHIYDSSYGLFNAYKNLMFHWNILASIAIQNMAMGINPISFKQVIRTLYRHFVVR